MFIINDSSEFASSSLSNVVSSELSSAISIYILWIYTQHIECIEAILFFYSCYIYTFTLLDRL